MSDKEIYIEPLVNYYRRSSRVIHKTKTNHYKLTNLNFISRCLRNWMKGEECILETSNKLGVSSLNLLKTYFVLLGVPKKEFYEAILKGSYGAYIDSQVELAIVTDFNFSKWGQRIQEKIGAFKEKLLKEALLERGYSLLTEADMRSKFSKTPDIYCNEGVRTVNGLIFWVESKAFYGDQSDYKTNLTKQLRPYRGLFGKGIVIYWHGFSKQLRKEDDILVMDFSEFIQSLR